MYRKILLPTDFSDCAAMALGAVIGLKEAGSREVLVLHVVDIRQCEQALVGTAWVKVDPGAYLKHLKEELTVNAESKIKEIGGEIEKAGMTARTRIVTGVPFREILRAADEERVDLIVIGSHGKSNIREMMLGSVSEKVVRKARQHVLVVKQGGDEAAGEQS